MKKLLKKAALSSVQDVLKIMNTTLAGLHEKQIKENREIFGTNKITQGKKKSLFKKICESFVNPFTAILFCLAVVSCFTDIIIPYYHNIPEDINPITVIIIITMVGISGFLRFIQETRSGNAAEKLLSMITATTSVIRKANGKEEIPLEEVVAGDIVFLATGDIIPADIRILEAKDLFVSQSSLTGESEPIEKTAKIADKECEITEYKNLAFMGSNVISGSAIGVVLSVGDNTLFGNMAHSVNEEPVPTSFEKGVNSVSWVLIRFMLVMVPVVFFINGLTKNNWTAAFFFAVSIAVGLTPEMLPMIVTTSLAKGAVSMSKKKTVVKNLNSIQNFGAMDILCTDKTGTLTQDKVVLEYHINVCGKEDNRVLRHAFLNSWYQTGLKNLMDLSIIQRTKEESLRDKTLENLTDTYKKIDEIPFDFSRRRMTVVVEDKEGKTQMITKGAVEEIFSICTHAEYKGKIEPLTDNLKNKILKTVDNFNNNGLRVIAVAQKNNPSSVDTFSTKDECNMVLIGYLAFLDPPKSTTASAIKALKEYGVAVKILTGDNEKVTKNICSQVGIKTDKILLGMEIEKMDDKTLKKEVEETQIFAKLSPDQKARIVALLREMGHTVGFMGDGINDAAAMKAADIGISVDTAVDIAKESADIILLEKDLMVLEQGIIEGRKTYANMIKYIKMTASSNFGNMFSVLTASAFLPFLPMTSIQLIFLNLVYDLSCVAVPWDNVDEEFLKTPRIWDASSVGKFMLWIGPVSSVFDITTYIAMYFVICPMAVSNGILYNALTDTHLKDMYEALFQTGWFILSIWTQTLVVHLIRTKKIPFLQSRASAKVTFMTLASAVFLSVIPYAPLGTIIGLVNPPHIFWLLLAATIGIYMISVTFVKNIYIKKYGELL